MSILDEIIQTKRAEIQTLLDQSMPLSLRQQAENAPACRPFLDSLRAHAPLALIAEIKKASPSKGVIEPDFRPAEMAVAYEHAGAAAISVLTDQTYFQGSAQILRTVKEHSSLPILRKDFIIDKIQVYESKAMGADAILLIVAALSDEELFTLFTTATEIGLAVLVEVHSVSEWERAARISPSLVGVNNRDLRDFKVDLSRTDEVAAAVGDAALLVSESGMTCYDDIQRVKAAGAQAVLIGETLMRFGLAHVHHGIETLFHEQAGGDALGVTR